MATYLMQCLCLYHYTSLASGLDQIEVFVADEERSDGRLLGTLCLTTLYRDPEVGIAEWAAVSYS